MVNNIIAFVKENYRLIIDVGAVLVSVVFFLLKKKPVKVVDAALDLIMSNLPKLILLAEKSGLKGKDKLDFVVASMIEALADLGYPEPAQYASLIKEQVEIILTTPQKKGCDVDGKK